MSANPKYFNNINAERSVAPFIPYSSHITDNTIITMEGDFIRCWKIAGIAFETVEPEDIIMKKEQLNTLLRSISSDHVALWTHNIRRRTSDRLIASYENDFCRDFDRKYYESFHDYRMMANELYLTVAYRPTPSKAGKAIVRSARRTIEEIKKDQAYSLRKFDDIAHRIEASLRKYGVDDKTGIEQLVRYEDESGVKYSQMLELFNYLISGVWQKVRVPNGPINEYLGTAWVFAGTETIEIRSPTNARYAQGIDFKDYTSHTEPGFLNGLMYEDYEYVITQSFSFLSKARGKDYLERQQKQLKNSEDGSIQQIEEMSIAIDELIQGLFVMGEYHYSMLVFGNSIDDVRHNTNSAMAIIQNQGFLASIISTATDAAFYAQLPCNWKYRPRLAGITSRNFAGLCSFHNFRAGKRDNNPWGQALTLLKTPSGQPLYFNFHYSKLEEDALDKKVLGNTRIIGQSGAGKTVLLNTLLCQSQKYKKDSDTGFTTIFFDKDEGAKILINAIGGRYLSIKNGVPSGLNPFWIEATEENILFLERLVGVIAATDGNQLSTIDESKISHAVRTVMRMPKSNRRLSILLQNITEGTDINERKNSLSKRLAKWCADDGNGKVGNLWWVFDNPEDIIDFTTHDNYGIDGTHFLDNKDIRTPISMYLLHRMESIIDGRRFIYWMDEAWKWVDDEAFSEFAGDKQLTIRKQNGLGVFSTQMPSSLLKSSIASALVQQVSTEIYLPNPKASYKEYTEGFLVTDTEYELIKNLGEDSRMFLIKQGHQSMMATLDLNGFDDELAILSGSTDNIEIFDSIVEKHGDDPEVWIPIFLDQINSRKSLKRKK